MVCSQIYRFVIFQILSYHASESDEEAEKLLVSLLCLLLASPLTFATFKGHELIAFVKLDYARRFLKVLNNLFQTSFHRYVI